MEIFSLVHLRRFSFELFNKILFSFPLDQMTDQWDSFIHQMNHSVQRSQMLASDVHQINRLQTKQLG